MESSLLRLLLNHSSEFLSLPHLCQQLQRNDLQVIDLLKTLTLWGYTLETHPTLGVRLLQLSAALHLDELRARLPQNHPWTLFHLNETPSTMDFIKREGIRGGADGTLVIANSQTAGRGRHGRSWNSRPELGLYLSVLLRPDFPISSYSRLTIIAAVATLQAAERVTQRRFQIKWPNDLMIGKRKLAGILTEAHLDQQQQPFAILGVGINLIQEVSDFPEELQTKASSLLIESQRSIRRTDFLLEWIERFQNALSLPFEEIVQEWKSKCLNLGESIVVTTPQGKIQGTALDLESNGALLLRDDQGKIHTILSGLIEV